MPPEVKNDEKTVNALMKLTDSERVFMLDKHDEVSGKAIYVDGYVEGPNEMIEFTDQKGQYHKVPAKRVAELTAKAEPAKPTK